MTTLLSKAKNILATDETILFYAKMFIRHIYLSFRRKARIANFNEQKTILLWARCK